MNKHKLIHQSPLNYIFYTNRHEYYQLLFNTFLQLQIYNNTIKYMILSMITKEGIIYKHHEIYFNHFNNNSL